MLLLLKAQAGHLMLDTRNRADILYNDSSAHAGVTGCGAPWSATLHAQRNEDAHPELKHKCAAFAGKPGPPSGMPGAGRDLHPVKTVSKLWFLH